MPSAPSDPIAFLEAAYRVEVPTSEWLSGIVDAARHTLDQGMGVTAMLYDATDVANMRVLAVEGTGGGRAEALARTIERGAPERIRWTFRTSACRVASEGPDWETTPAKALFARWGIEDVLCANGVDPTGIGCFLTAPLARRRRLSAAVRARWERVAAHLAAGYRLHRRLIAASTPPEVTLDPVGRLLDGPAEATEKEARRGLREAVRAMDRARGRARRAAPDEALEGWTALVDARWTLLDHFDSDGRRFVIARRNASDVPEAAELTERERQVLAYAALGHTNKLVAYELGIAASTVRVLFARAARKLGASSREEAIARFLAQTGELTRVP